MERSEACGVRDVRETQIPAIAQANFGGGNAAYRDLIRASLIVDVRFLAIGVMREYRQGREAREGPELSRKSILDAVYAGGRLQLPFDDVLLFGY